MEQCPTQLNVNNIYIYIYIIVCCEKPRKVGAKYSHKNFGRDEVITDLELDWEAKRDAYNGYNPDLFESQVEEWQAIEAYKKERKAEELTRKLEGVREEEDSSEDEKKFIDKDPKVRTADVFLRDRKDAAKYLLNLDNESAYYNAKSRSMRENPNPEKNAGMFKGENYARLTGDYLELLQQEKFVFEAQRKGGASVNSVAMPSQAELMYKNFVKERGKQKEKVNSELLERYGGGEHLEQPGELIQGENDVDVYTEFTQEGNPKPQHPQHPHIQNISSKYRENVHVGNHKSIWGSYWHEEYGWGFGCCFSHNKWGECLGEEGKRQELANEVQWEAVKRDNEDLLRQREIRLHNIHLLTSQGLMPPPMITSKADHTHTADHTTYPDHTDHTNNPDTHIDNMNEGNNNNNMDSSNDLNNDLVQDIPTTPDLLPMDNLGEPPPKDQILVEEIEPQIGIKGGELFPSDSESDSSPSNSLSSQSSLSSDYKEEKVKTYKFTRDKRQRSRSRSKENRRERRGETKSFRERRRDERGINIIIYIYIYYIYRRGYN